VTNDDLRDVVLDALTNIAPEADPATLDPGEDLREELDLDSMDELNLITALCERLGIDIPEGDYPQLRTLDGAVDYLARRTSAATA
jgi:acyl carrier protein